MAPDGTNRASLAWGSVLTEKESSMNATTISVDLAKSVFQIAVANDKWEVTESHRLTRSQLERWFENPFDNCSKRASHRSNNS